jgi:hypothetical protein
LRASEEVRAAAFPKSNADIDAEMVAIADDHRATQRPL